MAETPTPVGLMASINAQQNLNNSTNATANETLAAQIADKIKANSLNGETDDLTSFETKKKVDNVKQKMYVFGLAIVAYLIYGYVSASFNEFNANEAKISEIQAKIDTTNTEIEGFKSNETMLKMIASSQGSERKNLVNCINNSNLCEKVLSGMQKNIDVTRSYLLLTPLTGRKMDIDQKTLLKYFNEYLLASTAGTSSLLDISFTKPNLIEPTKQIYEVGIDTTITFSNKEALMEMIEKTEHDVSVTNPLLIKIKSINYDIVKYKEPQTVTISFVVYHYKK